MIFKFHGGERRKAGSGNSEKIIATAATHNQMNNINNAKDDQKPEG